MDAALASLAPGLPEERRTPPDRARLRAVLQTLMRQFLAEHPDRRYLQEHLQPKFVDGHVRTFCEYARYLPERGDVLDWGCHHAPDSCLLKAEFPGRFRLHGCDFAEPRLYAGFHEFAGLEYRQICEVVATPYAARTFDVVIGSGVLEHVAMDYESLKELHRILKPGGILVITYLPNWLSANEWVRRVIFRQGFHNRRYGLAEARQLLKRSGFLPLMARHAARGALFSPLRCFGSTLMLVARKVHCM